MKFGFPDGVEDGEHGGVVFVEISKIFANQDVFCFGTEPFSREELMLIKFFMVGGSQ